MSKEQTYDIIPAVRPGKEVDTKGKPSLSEKHKLFCLEYIRNGNNASRAYSTVYPSVKDTTAKANACRLLNRQDVKQFLQEYYNELWENRDLEIGKIFDALLELAHADIADVVEYKNGQMKIKDFQDSNTKIIQSISRTVTDTKDGQRVNESIKIIDRVKPLTELARILNMIKDESDNSQNIIVIPAVRPDKIPEGEV